MERHNKSQDIGSRWFGSRWFTKQQLWSQLNQKNQGVTNQGIMRRTQSASSRTILTLSIVMALILPLLPTANAPVAIAKEQTPDVPSSAVMQPTVIQIEEEIATISSSDGANARMQPDSGSEILKILENGETFTVAGRSYDDDNGLEWVAVQTAEDERAWVSAASIESTTQSTEVLVPAQAPNANILNTDEEIIYIDGNGRIKIFDVEQAGEQLVTWESPEIGFVDIAVGDFNNDGDAEIAGVKGSNAAGELIVYDPVLNSTTIQADPSSGEIPWAELYRQNIGFTPTVIAAGEFDQGIPGDEILFGYETGGSRSEIVVLKGDSLTPDGTGWLKHIPGDNRRGVDFPHIWETVSVANLNNDKTDEVVFTDSRFAPKSFLQIYRLDNGGLDAGVSAVDNNSSNRSWRGSTTGNVYGDSTPELIVFRKSTGNTVAGGTTVLISRFNGSKLEEEDGDAIIYNPQPSYAFTADINGEVDGNRDDEIILLRRVTGNDAGIRLIVVNRGNDRIDDEKTEQSLDADNRWKVGVGADVDGNNVDEVVLMQDNGIRIYRFEASGNSHLKLYRNDENVPTDGTTIRAANVDAIGFRSGSSLDYEISGPNGEVPAGEAATTFSVKLTTTALQDVQYQIQPVTQPDWVSGFSPRSGVMSSSSDVKVDIRVDATDLTPGTYSFNARLTTVGGDIINSPLVIPIEIEVTPALLQTNLDKLNFIYHGCEPPLDLEPVTRSLLVDGTLGVTFKAGIVDNPSFTAAQQSLSGAVLGAQLNDAGQLKLRDGWGNAATVQTASAKDLSASSLTNTAAMNTEWLAVTPDSGSVGNEIDITILPSSLPTTTTTAEALLIIVGDPSTGDLPNNVRFVPIRFLCASTDAHLPFAIRE